VAVIATVPSTRGEADRARRRPAERALRAGRDHRTRRFPPHGLRLRVWALRTAADRGRCGEEQQAPI